MENEWKEVKRAVHNFADEPEFTGLFLGSVDGEFGGKDFLFNVDGKEVLIYGKTALRSKMNMIKPGMICKIIYKGEITSPSSKRKYQDFIVYQKVTQYQKIGE
jgi:hypothetical protein